MKRVLAAGSVLALAAVLLQFRSAQEPASKDAPQPPPAPGPTHSEPQALGATAGMPSVFATQIPHSNPRQSAAGTSLTVHGLAPIPLGSRNDAPLEMAIDAVTQRIDLTDAERAGLLIQMLPSLPPEVLARAAEEATTRLPDADYTMALRPTLIDPQTHGMVMSVLFADLMQRPDAISLPILATIAQDQRHPYAQSAQDNLQFLLRVDFGNDWARWNEAIRVRLASPKR